MEMVLPDIARLGYDAKKHAYTLDGNKLLSGVTTVLSATSDKAQLINWSANMAVEYVKENSIRSETAYVIEERDLEDARTAHTRKKEAAGTRGTDVHALVEHYILECIKLNDGVPLPTPQALIEGVNPIEPFIAWATGEVERFIAAEQKLYDEENAVAGTADFFYIAKGGEFCVGDLKTFVKLFNVDPYVQIATYARMWGLLTGVHPTRGVIVKMCDPTDERLAKYGTQPFSVYERNALEEDGEIFLKRLAIYRHAQNFKSPNY